MESKPAIWLSWSFQDLIVSGIILRFYTYGLLEFQMKLQFF